MNSEKIEGNRILIGDKISKKVILLCEIIEYDGCAVAYSSWKSMR